MDIKILPLPFHELFLDAAKVFQSEYENGLLCFGCQDWSIEQIKQIKETAIHEGKKIIAYQSELLIRTGLPFMKQSYLEKLQLFDEVWEYSEYNIPILQDNNIPIIKYKPILPNPILKDSPYLIKDIDILHFGTPTNRRLDFLQYVKELGYDITMIPDKPDGDYVYGKQLHKLIRRSRVILGIHAWENAPIQESFRYQYPLSNKIPVIAEKSLSNPLHLQEFETKEEMIYLIQEYCKPRSTIYRKIKRIKRHYLS